MSAMTRSEFLKMSDIKPGTFVRTEAYMRELIATGFVNRWSDCNYNEKRQMVLLFREEMPIERRRYEDQLAISGDGELIDTLTFALEGTETARVQIAITRALIQHYGHKIERQIFERYQLDKAIQTGLVIDDTVAA